MSDEDKTFLGMALRFWILELTTSRENDLSQYNGEMTVKTRINSIIKLFLKIEVDLNYKY